jgi:1-acyl-sn-glycerol-3-phosphate acyltransferase
LPFAVRRNVIGERRTAVGEYDARVLRTAWVALIALLDTIPFATATLVVAMFKSNAKIIDPLIRTWARVIVRAAGIDLRTEGADKIDRNQRYILVANHYSYFDIPCIFAAVEQPIRFMAKVSLFKIPIFGWALARAGFIPIDRKNRRTAVKSFDLAVERIRKGNTIVVFPEEGRSRERAMRPFQRGGFLLALKSGLPILPVAIDGTYDVFRAGATRVTPGVVTIRIGTPIPTEGLTVRSKQMLADQARGQILEMLGMRAESEG